MRSSRTVFLVMFVFVILIGMSQGDAVAEVNRWNAFSSPAFSQGFVQTGCSGQTPCQDDDFNLSGSSSTECPEGGGGFPTYGCRAFTTSTDTWEIEGYAGHNPGPIGDVFIGTIVNVDGERVDADLFTATATANYFEPGPAAEVAVFRYFGDPSVFDGLEVGHVQELVDLGIIGSDDILAVGTTSDSGPIELQVQVTGLSDDEIVVFAAGDGRLPPNVPATTVIGTTVLLLVMLVAGTWALRRRNA